MSSVQWYCRVRFLKQISFAESMEDRRKTLVLFDVGAVLLYLTYDRFFEEAANLSKDKTAGRIRELYIGERLEPRGNTGELSTPDYLQRVREILNPAQQLSDEGLVQLLSKRFEGGPIQEMVALKKRLHEAGYSVGIFSNTRETDAKVWLQNYPEMVETYSALSPAIFSYAVGAEKPQQPMYQKVTGFEKVIYIDDKRAYLKPGVELGWYGIWFTPYIDKEEIETAGAIEVVLYQQPRFRRADSVDELVAALNEFGVQAA